MAHPPNLHDLTLMGSSVFVSVFATSVVRQLRRCAELSH